MEKETEHDVLSIPDLLSCSNSDTLDDGEAQLDIETFEMTTPRPGEDYSTWCLMAAAAASACQQQIELLENEDGLIFQDFLNGRKLTPSHALGLLQCGCGAAAADDSVETGLPRRALGARLILGPKCLDIGDLLSKNASSAAEYGPLWDMLLPRKFLSERHAHFAIWTLTQAARRETQRMEIMRLFKDDPSFDSDEVLVQGFSTEIFRRGSWKYMLEWVLDHPSAHDLLMLTLSLEIPQKKIIKKKKEVKKEA